MKSVKMNAAVVHVGQMYPDWHSAQDVWRSKYMYGTCVHKSIQNMSVLFSCAALYLKVSIHHWPQISLGHEYKTWAAARLLLGKLHG